jgi:hypothetical protein
MTSSSVLRASDDDQHADLGRRLRLRNDRDERLTHAIECQRALYNRFRHALISFSFLSPGEVDAPQRTPAKRCIYLIARGCRIRPWICRSILAGSQHRLRAAGPIVQNLLPMSFS